MPPKSRNSEPKQAKRRPGPYNNASKSKSRHKTPALVSFDPPYPPLPVGEESQLDVIREVVMKRFPLFRPRNDLDIIAISGHNYNGPPDHDSICDFIDNREIKQLMDMNNWTREEAIAVSTKCMEPLVRTPGTEVINIKPRPGQKTCVRPVPSCPQYSIRLWPSSPSKKLIAMDFVESATGAPINLSHRLHVYGTGNMIAPDLSLRINPFFFPGLPQEPIRPGEEIYYLRAEHSISVHDILASSKDVTRILTFKAPKHPAKIPEPEGVKRDILHFSLED